jgi:hypothetical protein
MTNAPDHRSRERADTPREHDDSELIDDNLETPHQGGRSGGNLATDVGTQAAEERVGDPDAHEGVDKADDIAHGEAYPSNRGPDR